MRAFIFWTHSPKVTNAGLARSVDLAAREVGLRARSHIPGQDGIALVRDCETRIKRTFFGASSG